MKLLASLSFVVGFLASFVLVIRLESNGDHGLACLLLATMMVVPVVALLMRRNEP